MRGWSAARSPQSSPPESLSELDRALAKPYVAGKLSADDLVLATAERGNAAYIVTGDRELRMLGRFLDIEIVSPRRFLDVLPSPDDVSGRHGTGDR